MHLLILNVLLPLHIAVMIFLLFWTESQTALARTLKKPAKEFIPFTMFSSVKWKCWKNPNLTTENLWKCMERGIVRQRALSLTLVKLHGPWGKNLLFNNLHKLTIWWNFDTSRYVIPVVKSQVTFCITKFVVFTWKWNLKNI